MGQKISDKIWQDNEDIYAYEKADSAYSQRKTDVAVVEAARDARFPAVIVSPPTIC